MKDSFLSLGDRKESFMAVTGVTEPRRAEIRVPGAGDLRQRIHRE